MAVLSLQELRELTERYRNWEAAGFTSAGNLVAIELRKTDHGEQRPLNPGLANQTLTYEGRDMTLVLDFDEKGFLIEIQLV